MNVPVEYDNKLEFRITHPELLPQENKIILENMEINRSKFPSRSVLGDLSKGCGVGILKNSENYRNPKNSMSWARSSWKEGPRY